MPLNILIAEDEKAIADIYGRALVRHGHRVVVALDGLTCLTEYMASLDDKEKTPYDVVVIDHELPHIKGSRLAKKILNANPQQRIVFVSGYGLDLLKNLDEIDVPIEFMTKPFNIDRLVELIEN